MRPIANDMFSEILARYEASWSVVDGHVSAIRTSRSLSTLSLAIEFFHAVLEVAQSREEGTATDPAAEDSRARFQTRNVEPPSYLLPLLLIKFKDTSEDGNILPIGICQIGNSPRIVAQELLVSRNVLQEF